MSTPVQYAQRLMDILVKNGNRQQAYKNYLLDLKKREPTNGSVCPDFQKGEIVTFSVNYFCHMEVSYLNLLHKLLIIIYMILCVYRTN